MTRRLRPAPGKGDPAADAGASLLITLAFVMFVGLVASALLSFGGTSIIGAGSSKYRADMDYDAGNALSTAINQIRNSTYDNAATTSSASLQECGKFLNTADGTGSATTLTQYGTNLKRNVAVTCEGGPKTGVNGGNTAISSANRPEYSLITLGTTGNGFHMQGSNHDLGIRGPVYINSGALANPGTVFVTGALTARDNTCTKFDSPAKNCSTGNPVLADPGAANSAYDVPVPAGGEPVYRAVPACPTDGRETVELFPGYYDDATALEALTDDTSCGTHTVWFHPGTYYFDFHNGEGSPYAAGNRTWTIGDPDVRVVAGTPDGWTAATGFTGTVDAPGACKSPNDTLAAGTGAVFVFGGDSALDINGGRTEICGQYSADKPPFAIYGSKSNIGSTSSGNNPTLLPDPTTATTPAGATAFANVARVTTDDGTDASSATGAVTSTKDAAIELGDFATTPAIPAGSVLTSAVLTLTHREELTAGQANKVTVPAVTLTPNRAGGPALVVPDVTEQVAATFVEDEIDVLDLLGEEVHEHGLTNGLTFKLTAASTGATYTERLEYVALKLTWTTRPVFRAEAAAGPQVISTPGTDAYAFIQGTTYVPRATVDIDLKKGSRLTFKWGLVARGLVVKMYGNTDQPTSIPIFEIPDDVHGPDVYFKAYTYTCPGNANSCSSPAFPAPPTAPSAAWRLAASARVTYEGGPDIANPSAGHRDVTVHSWTTYR